LRKSTTSTEMLSLANSSAAAKATLVIFPKVAMVTSVPERLMSAWPIGIRYSSAGTSPLSPYINSDSMKITGSLSRMDDFNNPFASYGFEGTPTFKPGQLAYQFSKFCECWAPSWPALPVAPRKSMGTLYCPPDMEYILAAELMIGS